MTSPDENEQVIRYFDGERPTRRAPNVLTRRTLAHVSAIAAIACALIALWLVVYPVYGWLIGLGLVAVGIVALITAWWADRSVVLLPILALVLLLVAAGLTGANLAILWLLSQTQSP